MKESIVVLVERRYMLFSQNILKALKVFSYKQRVNARIICNEWEQNGMVDSFIYSKSVFVQFVQKVRKTLIVRTKYLPEASAVFFG